MICDKTDCTGCFGCYNICPKNAIDMIKDEFGNVYPKINEDRCINCGLCKKVCPQLKEELDFREPITAYAMYNKDSEKRKASTSGGAATTFYENILKNNGVVYGVSNLFGEDSFKFIRIDNIEDLYKVKGSKYVHCYINNAFKEVKNDLINKKEVLFIGTPCQISGLKSFLMKDYENLITIDIICHGVPSQELLFEEIKSHNIDYHNVSYVFFRDENLFNFKLLGKNKEVLFEDLSSNVPYYRNFLQGNIYRENCYNCRYAQRKRISDITIGDFWGLAKNAKIYDDESKGISVIMPNTEKGLNLVNSIIDESVIEERTIDEACKQNGQLNHPMKKNEKYEIYVNNYKKIGYKKTMNKMLNFKDKVKIKIKGNKFIYNFYKKLKK